MEHLVTARLSDFSGPGQWLNSRAALGDNRCGTCFSLQLVYPCPGHRAWEAPESALFQSAWTQPPLWFALRQDGPGAPNTARTLNMPTLAIFYLNTLWSSSLAELGSGLCFRCWWSWSVYDLSLRPHRWPPRRLSNAANCPAPDVLGPIIAFSSSQQPITRSCFPAQPGIDEICNRRPRATFRGSVTPPLSELAASAAISG